MRWPIFLLVACATTIDDEPEPYVPCIVYLYTDFDKCVPVDCPCEPDCGGNIDCSACADCDVCDECPTADLEGDRGCWVDGELRECDDRCGEHNSEIVCD